MDPNELLTILDTPGSELEISFPREPFYKFMFNLTPDIFKKILYHQKFKKYLKIDFISDGLTHCENNQMEILKIILDYPEIILDSTFINKILLDYKNFGNTHELINLFAMHSIYEKTFKSFFVFDDNNDEQQLLKIINTFANPCATSFANLLEDEKFNPSSFNKRGDTIIHLLCDWNMINIDILNVFFSCPRFDPNINIKNEYHSITILQKILKGYEKNDTQMYYQMIVKLLEHPLIKLDGLNILSHACVYGDISLIELFLSDKRIDPNEKRNERAAIDEVISLYNIELLKVLLNDPRVIIPSDQSIINSLCFSLNTAYDDKHLSSLLEKLPNFVKFIFDNMSKSNLLWNTLVAVAIHNGYIDLLRIMLAYKDFVVDMYGERVSFIKSNIYDILQLLRDDGRFDSVVFLDNNTLYHIVFISSFECITENELNKINKLLLDWGINPSIRNKFGSSALHFICNRGIYQILFDICERYPNIDLNAVDIEDNTILYNACDDSDDYIDVPDLKSRYELIKFLFNHPSIDLTKVDKQGRNLFHRLCLHSTVNIIKFLIEDICIPDFLINGIDNDGFTPLNFICEKSVHASTKNRLNIIEYLLTIDRIDFHKPNHSGHTCVYYIFDDCIFNHQKYNEKILKIAQYMIKNINGIIIPKHISPILIKAFEENKI